MTQFYLTSSIALPIAETVRVSGLTRTHIYLALQKGEIRAVKAGRRTLVLTESLRAYLDALPAASFRAVPAKVA